jgi:hypothetical protein
MPGFDGGPLVGLAFGRFALVTGSDATIASAITYLVDKLIVCQISAVTTIVHTCIR